ncbi:hypothetical protein PF007_g21754 [Phytophthora fragariae]|uniref:Clathrin/coatomer adaptor adaptin-like N-terminal domain-containing protein n=1 Tax=Phytophthora fragariae TaxID=53985 RepID=A0A6A3QUX5_9STRA|nr:hypothetical protein PF007_g21754 [Phytophthora fragariae]KAE9245321.1 hypothetical protein PF004_g5275 [Phytophthora fragariae]
MTCSDLYPLVGSYCDEAPCDWQQYSTEIIDSRLRMMTSTRKRRSLRSLRRSLFQLYFYLKHGSLSKTAQVAAPLCVDISSGYSAHGIKCRANSANDGTRTGLGWRQSGPELDLTGAVVVTWLHHLGYRGATSSRAQNTARHSQIGSKPDSENAARASSTAAGCLVLVGRASHGSLARWQQYVWRAGAAAFKISNSVLQKLLAALNECNEWGQVFLLDALAGYTPSDSREAEGIIERVTPRLQHVNSAVVLSAVKVIVKFLEKVSDADTERRLSRKMAPPLVTLLSAEHEIQYVALRNINLIVQKRPAILTNEIKVFFCKYNDPIYVKMDKLEIIIRLVSERNIEQVLLEFKESATEVNVEFVRRSVRAIGRCAVKLEHAAEKCINVLLELIQTKMNYIVQEAINVIMLANGQCVPQHESVLPIIVECLLIEIVSERSFLVS